MDPDAAAKAIETFNGRELNGRAINVNEARPRPERNVGGGGGGGGGYGGGRGHRSTKRKNRKGRVSPAFRISGASDQLTYSRTSS
jgi:RNA recognition motif-containing protein